MASESPFFNIPGELRNEIYRYYLTFEDGLVYNFDYGGKDNNRPQNILGNLAPANKKDRIDLALRSTCKQAHAETEGLILKFNTIAFLSTRISRMNSDEVRVRAARFHFLRVPLTMDAASFLYYEDDTVVRPCYTKAVVDEVVRTYPSIGPLLRTLLKENTQWAEIGSAHRLLQARPHDHCPDQGHRQLSWGMVPSLMRRALMHTLQVTADHDCFSDGPAAQRPTFPPREMVALDSEFPAWSIPTDDDLLKLSRAYAWKGTDFCDYTYCHSSRQLHTAEFWNAAPYYTVPNDESSRHFMWGLGPEIEMPSNNRGKYRFSAASVAIKFLSSLPSKLRLQLRHIRLLENNLSVAFPESHAQGLIRFCVENPKLRVERRVNLWNTIFKQPTNHVDHLETVINCVEVPEDEKDSTRWFDHTGHSTVMATNNIALWLMEAAALAPAGMPEKSFTLVLDGAPGDEVISDIFMNYIQRDAAWQTAWEIASEQKYAKSKSDEQQTDDHFMDLRSPSCYIYPGFPQVIDDIAKNRSKLIQCTFNTGPQLWDAEAELNKHQPHSKEIWDTLRVDHREMFYWRQLEPRERSRFDEIVYRTEILPYKPDDEYFSD